MRAHGVGFLQRTADATAGSRYTRMRLLATSRTARHPFVSYGPSDRLIYVDLKVDHVYTANGGTGRRPWPGPPPIFFLEAAWLRGAARGRAPGSPDAKAKGVWRRFWACKQQCASAPSRRSWSQRCRKRACGGRDVSGSRPGEFRRRCQGRQGPGDPGTAFWRHQRQSRPDRQRRLVVAPAQRTGRRWPAEVRCGLVVAPAQRTGQHSGQQRARRERREAA